MLSHARSSGLHPCAGPDQTSASHLGVHKNTERLGSAQATARAVVLDEYSLYSLYSAQNIRITEFHLYFTQHRGPACSKIALEDASKHQEARCQGADESSTSS